MSGSVQRSRTVSPSVDIDTVFALKTAGFILFGTADLSVGSVTVPHTRIRLVSVAMLTYKTHGSIGRPPAMRRTMSAGKGYSRLQLQRGGQTY